MSRRALEKELAVLRKKVEELKQAQMKSTGNTGGAATGENQQDGCPPGEHPAYEKTALAGNKTEVSREALMERLDDIAVALKKEYAQLSPMGAIVLFGLGALFGRALSSRK